MPLSMSASFTASGNSQSTGTPISARYNRVTIGLTPTGSNSAVYEGAVVLPGAAPGMSVEIAVDAPSAFADVEGYGDAPTLTIYPALGESILSTGGVNEPIQVAGGFKVLLNCFNPSVWQVNSVIK